MGRQDRDQGRLFYEFNLDDVIPRDHLLRRMNVFVSAALDDLHQQLRAYYSDIGRPSVDPELMIRMLIVGYCYGIRHERRLCEEVKLHLGFRWFCKLDLIDKVPHHSPPARPTTRTGTRVSPQGGAAATSQPLREQSCAATNAKQPEPADNGLFRQHRPTADIGRKRDKSHRWKLAWSNYALQGPGTILKSSKIELARLLPAKARQSW
jgi:Transposase domain (DUF772)